MGTVAAPVYPLHVESGRRYLVDASGRPFLMQGDAAWSILVQLTREDAVRYLDDRRARGFNTLLVNLLEHKFSNNPPNNVYGQGPFTVPGDFSTPNESYFAHVDYVLQQAASRGFLVVLVPSYTGYKDTDHGWYEEMKANGVTKMREYGRYVGRRYGGLSNIIWAQGGDSDPPQKELSDAIALGIAETDPGVLQTAHGAPDTPPLDYWAGYPWLAVNNVYTYGDVYTPAIREFARTAMPYFLMESAYENENGADTRRLRTQAYHAVLSGATGQIFGNNPMWMFDGPGLWPENTTWQASLDSPGARSMTAVGRLLQSRAWWRLEPDTNGQLLTAGVGSGQDRAVAAQACDGTFAVAYIPTSRSITLNLGRLSGGSVRLTWYDPSNGATAPATASPVPAGSPVQLSTPGSNAGGAPDWVIIAEPA